MLYPKCTLPIATARSTVENRRPNRVFPYCKLPDCLEPSSAIIVCGHAVYTGGPLLPPSELPNDEHWTLLPYQAGEGRVYLEHISAAVELAREDPDALLIFSGGQTREGTFLSEAVSYYHAAEAAGLLKDELVRRRVTTEEFSRDSFDNCLFGIARFAECTGAIPHQITVVSWKFKKERFNLHALATLRWPADKFSFCGVGAPADMDAALKGEAGTVCHFRADMTGHGAALGPKKAARNPHRRQHGYATSFPALRRLVEYVGAEAAPLAICPWNAAFDEKL